MYQGGARGGGKAYGGVYTATTAAPSYPTQAYSAAPAQPAKRQYIHVNIGTELFGQATRGSAVLTRIS